jgi:hypothetical protein
MDIFFHHSYNLDLLNLLNIVNGDPHFKKLYPQVFAEFGQPLSLDSKNVLQQISQAMGTTLISAPIAFGISIIPQFEKESLLDLLMDRDRFLTAVEQNEPRLMAQKEQLLILFQVLAPVIQELETLGFREYWLSECLPVIENRLDAVEKFYLQSGFYSIFNELMEQEDLPEELNVFFCVLNGGNGVRLSNHTPVIDISFPTEKIFDFALHEFFQHQISKPDAKKLLETLVNNSFLEMAFEKSRDMTGINSISSYLQENVTTAYKSFLFHKSGLLADPIGFLREYQQGALILAVILVDHLIWDGLRRPSMIDDVEDWLKENATNSFMDLYKKALERAGKTLGDQ